MSDLTESEPIEYVADYEVRRLLRPDCIHGVPLTSPCGTCEYEISMGETIFGPEVHAGEEARR